MNNQFRKKKKNQNSAGPILAHGLRLHVLVALGVSQSERPQRTEAADPPHGGNRPGCAAQRACSRAGHHAPVARMPPADPGPRCSGDGGLTTRRTQSMHRATLRGQGLTRSTGRRRVGGVRGVCRHFSNGRLR
jgi:hypothetical protein